MGYYFCELGTIMLMRNEWDVVIVGWVRYFCCGFGGKLPLWTSPGFVLM